MRRYPFSAILPAVLAAAVVLVPVSHAQNGTHGDFNLPQLGEPADASLSPAEEREIGASITAQIHAAGFALEDTELVDYFSRIGWRIASHTGSDLPRLQFFVVRDPRINAFALPGGFMGFNAGLIMAAETESELAGVIAHELAHVTQRHIARTIEGTKAANLATWAAVLAAIIAGSGNPDVILGALSLGQAANLQRQINFTRQHELEADRIGIRTMMRAGYDPAGMVNFFQRLEQQSRLYGSGLPEMLRTHPVNTTRIAEARARASDHDGDRSAERPLEFQLMQARARVFSSSRPSQALDYFARRIDAGAGGVADHYGAALALHELANYEGARKMLDKARERHPDQPNLLLLQASIQRATADVNGALATLESALDKDSRYAPLIFAYAETLMDSGEAGKARQFLLAHARHVEDYPESHRYLARAAQANNDPAELAFQSASYSWRRGDAVSAILHLDAGLRHASISDQERARLNSFRAEVRSVLPDNWRPPYDPEISSR